MNFAVLQPILVAGALAFAAAAAPADLETRGRLRRVAAAATTVSSRVVPLSLWAAFWAAAAIWKTGPLVSE